MGKSVFFSMHVYVCVFAFQKIYFSLLNRNEWRKKNLCDEIYTLWWHIKEWMPKNQVKKVDKIERWKAKNEEEKIHFQNFHCVSSNVKWKHFFLCIWNDFDASLTQETARWKARVKDRHTDWETDRQTVNEEMRSSRKIKCASRQEILC